MANKVASRSIAGLIFLIVAAAVLIFTSSTFKTCIDAQLSQTPTIASLSDGRLILGSYSSCAVEALRINFEISIIAAAFLTALFSFAAWRSMRHAQHAEADYAALRQKAYVGVTSIDIDAPNLSSAEFEVPASKDAPPTYKPADFLRIAVSNFGKTPARRVLVVANWAAMPLNRDFSYTFDYRDQLTRDEIASAGRPTVDPGNHYVVAFPLSKLKPFRDAASQTATVYVYGHIDYSDIFERRWRRDFCYVYDAATERVRPYADHNDEYSIAAADEGYVS